MTTDKYSHVYFFEIEQPAHDYAGFAKILKRKKEDVTETDALEEIENGLTGWLKHDGGSSSQSLDIKLANREESLIFVALPRTENGTFFGKDTGVSELELPGKLNKVVVKKQATHSLGGIADIMVAFVVTPQETCGEIRPNSSDTLTRLPITFQFVDRDGLSPFFKKPHSRKNEKSIFGHGGIHPPTASNIIEF